MLWCMADRIHVYKVVIQEFMDANKLNNSLLINFLNLSPFNYDNLSIKVELFIYYINIVYIEIGLFLQTKHCFVASDLFF